jgi:hypothetical protein
MFVKFDRGPHWVSAYRARFQGGLPPLQMRICTKSKPYADPLPTNVPNYPGYPPKLIFTLLATRPAPAAAAPATIRRVLSPARPAFSRPPRPDKTMASLLRLPEDPPGPVPIFHRARAAPSTA